MRDSGVSWRFKLLVDRYNLLLRHQLDYSIHRLGLHGRVRQQSYRPVKMVNLFHFLSLHIFLYLISL